MLTQMGVLEENSPKEKYFARVVFVNNSDWMARPLFRGFLAQRLPQIYFCRASAKNVLISKFALRKTLCQLSIARQLSADYAS